MNWGSLLENAKAVAEKLEDQLNESVGASRDVLDGKSKARSKQESNLPSITDGDVEDESFDDDFYTSDDDFDVSMHDKEQPETKSSAGSGDSVNLSERLEESPLKEKDTDTDHGEKDVEKEEPLHSENEYNSRDTDELNKEEDFNSTKDHDPEKSQPFDSSTSKSEDTLKTHNSGTLYVSHTESEVDADNTQQDVKDDIVEPATRQIHPDLHVEHDKNSECPSIESSVIDEVECEEKKSFDTDESDDLSVYVSKEEAARTISGNRNGTLGDVDTHNQKLKDLESELSALKRQLMIQKEEITSKDNQISSITQAFEQEKITLESKVRDTKEEAKKRIAKAKEKVDSLKAQLSDASRTANNSALTSSEQDEIIKALRMEGENLAKKQCDMEQLVRDARSDIKKLKEDLEEERKAKETAEKKVTNLEDELKLTKDNLSAAKAKGGLADKLDSDLLAAREEREKNALIISNLELELKQAKAENIETKKQMDLMLKEKISQMETQAADIHKEKDSLLNDLETKLRTSERESNLREDSLRHEVAELRKRWQESVRRCDALSIDLQQSSGPLLRQLESAERQNRSRANAWAELESKLRTDLEESLHESLKLSKEKREMETEMKSLHREIQSKESELETANLRLSDMSKRISLTNDRYEAVVKELDSLQLEFTALEQRHKDKESKIISEMTVTLRESEERFNDHVDSLEVELRQEKETRQSLEGKIKELMENVSDTEILSPYATAKSQKRNLGKADGQANILQSTLMSINGNDHEEDDEDVFDQHIKHAVNNDSNSFAFMEEMTQALSRAKAEVETLRNQLDESHHHRSELESELSRIKEHINNKDMEIRALEEDIVEVRHMFRSQIDALMAKDTEKPNTVKSVPSVSSSFVGMRTF